MDDPEHPRGSPAEEWRSLPGFAGYEVSNLGRVLSRKGKAPRILVQIRMPIGYLYVNMRDGDGYAAPRYVHRLVLLAFCGRPQPEQQCRHLDGSRTNNRLSNLRWGTSLENADDRRRHGRIVSNPARGEDQYNHILSEGDVREIRDLLKTGLTQVAIGQRYGVKQPTVSAIKTGRIWEWLK